MSAELPILVWFFVAYLVIDAIICAIPLKIVAQDLDRMGVSARTQALLAPVKAAAAVGLVIGLWVPVLGIVTALCVIAYFGCAVAVHLRAGDHWARSVPAAALGVWALVLVLLSYRPGV